MQSLFDRMLVAFKRAVPDGSATGKLLQVVAVVLLFEGISVLILYSKAGIVAGIISVVLGLLLFILTRPEKRLEVIGVTDETPGIRIISTVVRWVGGNHSMMAIGASIIALDILYNKYLSARQGLGDLDTLSLLLGGMLIAYPFVVRNYKVEASFSLLFLALVVVFLVVPQAVTSAKSESANSIGNWYVNDMLVRPFAGMLNLLGIDASSSGSYVTIEFRDGSFHTLGVSAYCAGLYSFSIFLASFFSFVLVFERLPKRTLLVVLGLGLLIAYFGNLMRMVIIGVVGYYRGMDSLLWAHENVGWIIFLGWSAVFWYLLLNYVSKRPDSGKDANEGN